MTGQRRSYSQNCALAHAVDLLGERWTLLIVRDLLVRPRRYNELLRSLRGMGTNLLAARLKQMEHDQLISCTVSSRGHKTYQLTELGQTLEPAVLELIRWGFRLNKPSNSTYHHQDDWDLLALKAAFVPNPKREITVTVGFTQPEFCWASIRSNTIDFGFDQQTDCDAVVEGSLQQFAKSPEQLKVRGNKRKLSMFSKAFEL